MLHEGTGPEKNGRYFAYKCPAGKLTIGIGRNIDLRGGRGMSKDEIDYLAANDIHDGYSHLASVYPWFNTLNDARQACLIDMFHNLGPQKLSAFRNTLGLVSVGRYKDAAAQMLQSKWAGQVGKRAVRVSWMMEHGRWPGEIGE